MFARFILRVAVLTVLACQISVFVAGPWGGRAG